MIKWDQLVYLKKTKGLCQRGGKGEKESKKELQSNNLTS